MVCQQMALFPTRQGMCKERGSTSEKRKRRPTRPTHHHTAPTRTDMHRPRTDNNIPPAAKKAEGSMEQRHTKTRCKGTQHSATLRWARTEWARCGSN